MKELITGDDGKLSSMRLSYLICMFLSTALTITSIVGVFYGKDMTQFLSTAVLFAGIGTAGKATQKFTETKQ